MKKFQAGTIGERVAIARLQRGLTQSELGRLVKKSKQLVSAAEAGRSTLMAPTLAEIGKVLSVDVRWLLFGGEDPKLPTLPRGREIPLLSAKQIGRMASGKHKAGVAEKTIFTSSEISDDAFAYTLADNGMRPALLAGDIAVVDPGQTPMTGAVVVATVFRDGGVKLADPVILVREVRFNSLRASAPPFSLVAHREGYPTVEVGHPRDATIVGVVTAVTRILKHEGERA